MAGIREHRDGRQRRWVVVWREPETRRGRRLAFSTLAEAKTFVSSALAAAGEVRQRSQRDRPHGQ